jgi:hypothetical protein
MARILTQHTSLSHGKEQQPLPDPPAGEDEKIYYIQDEK